MNIYLNAHLIPIFGISVINSFIISVNNSVFKNPTFLKSICDMNVGGILESGVFFECAYKSHNWSMLTHLAVG